MSEDRLLAIADELYALPLGDFTAARDAAAREHKADKPLASAVKALRKASVAAWVVDLLVRRDPEQVDQVLEVGTALREAAANLDAAQLRELTRQRRQLTAAVTTSARRLARSEGVKVTEPVADQVEATLTAAMLDAEVSRAVRSGLLVTAVTATGVDAVDLSRAVAVPEALGFRATAREAEPEPAPGRPELHVVPDPDADQKARAAADGRVAEAEEAVQAAREELGAAEEQVAALEARSMQLQAEVEELRRVIAEKESAQESVDDELEDAEAAAEESRAAAEEAEHELDAARAARRRLDR